MSKIATHYTNIATGEVVDTSAGVTARKVEGCDDLLPEAQNLVWTDTFFDDEDGVIAVFDFDYALMEDFYVKSGYAATIPATLISMLFPPAFCVMATCLIPCMVRPRVQWDIYANHVAVTRDGIRFVKEKRKTLYGCSCSDAGRSSKTVPFDKITDCDIEFPGGATCLCIQNVLTTVNIDTASSGGVNSEGMIRHELRITGLKEPEAFRKLVWALKRSNGTAIAANVVPSTSKGPPASAFMMRDNSEEGDMKTILIEIRDGLREQNKLLKSNKDVCDATDAKSII